MRRKITKGEAAKLLGITKSQIRFYEKKGLIKPDIDENGYAMYDFSLIDELEIILFLRDMDTSISEIKELLSSTNDYNYLEILKRADHKIDLELKELHAKKKNIRKRMALYAKSNVSNFTVEHYKRRFLHVADESFENVSIKDAYDLVQKYDVDFADYSNDLCRLYDKDKFFAGLINDSKTNLKKSTEKIEIPAGDYFSYTFTYDKYREVFTNQKSFNQKCSESDYTFDDGILFIEHFSKPYLEKGKGIATFQRRIV